MNDLTEEKARRLPAGSDLDILVATRFLGWELKTKKCFYTDRQVEILIPPKRDISTFGATRYSAQPPPEFSRDWMYAGPLLEAMNAEIHPPRPDRFRAQQRWMAKAVCPDTGSNLAITYGADYPETGGCPCLAIARTCAVLVAQGITVDDVNQPAP